MAVIARVSALLLMPGLVVFAGCVDSSNRSNSESNTFVEVFYDGKPLANVQVLVKQTSGGPTLARAITNQHGLAYLVELPSPEPKSYFVAMESIGDGSWMLKPSVMKEFSDSHRLKPFSESPQQKIELPHHAMHSLSPRH